MCMVAMNCLLIFMLSSISMYGGSTDTIDNYGHFGGLITGVWIGLIIPNPLEDSTYARNCRFVGLALLGTWFFLSFLLFYTTANMPNYNPFGK